MNSLPRWLPQVAADLERHEGFREFAYPDPLSYLGKKYKKLPWGFKPAEIILAEIGESSDKGAPWTYGYGFTHGVTFRSRISKEQARHRLVAEILEHAKILDRLIPSWVNMPLFVQTVLVNLAFNMGYNTLKQFRNTLNVVAQGRYKEAGYRLTKSLWYKQVGSRARELVWRLENGKIQEKYRVPDFSNVVSNVSTKPRGDSN